MGTQRQAASGIGLGKLYGALWRHAEGSRHLVVAFIFLLVAAQAARLAIPYFFGNAVNDLQQGGNDGVRGDGFSRRWRACAAHPAPAARPGPPAGPGCSS